MAALAIAAGPTGFSRVPKVTVGFWLVKLLAVTVGETAADYLAVNLGLGLSATTWLMSVVLAAALLWQFSQRRYVPASYWVAVVMVSIVGTLITDNLTDGLEVPLQTTAIVCGIALAATFAIWCQVEKTLSIHTIFTFRREAFYWLAILLTFALGTAAGDLVAEVLNFGYLTTGFLFGAIIGIVAVAYFGMNANAIWSFWLAYIFTRPLGASFGDLLSQPMEYGGLGFGTVGTSAIFLTAIALTIVYMSIKRTGEETVPEIGG